MKHRLQYLFVVGLQSIVRLLPNSLIRICGAAIGMGAYALDVSHREVAFRNIAATFSELSAPERRRVVRAVFAHFGSMLLELLKISTQSRERILEMVDFEGEEHVRRAYSRRRGVLFFTGHFGYWEQQAIVHGLKFGPMAVLARPLDNPHLNGMLERVRVSTGNSVIYRKGAVRRALRTLASGQAVGLLIDQHLLSPEVVSVDFLGRKAATTAALAAIALRTGAPVVPLFAFPLPQGRYRMIYEEPVQPPHADTPDAVHEFTQRCTHVLELHVRRHPELWLWMHRRWRDGGTVTDETAV